jgi:hypothetical protein
MLGIEVFSKCALCYCAYVLWIESTLAKVKY